MYDFDSLWRIETMGNEVSSGMQATDDEGKSWILYQKYTLHLCCCVGNVLIGSCGIKCFTC